MPVPFDVGLACRTAVVIIGRSGADGRPRAGRRERGRHVER